MHLLAAHPTKSASSTTSTLNSQLHVLRQHLIKNDTTVKAMGTAPGIAIIVFAGNLHQVPPPYVIPGANIREFLSTNIKYQHFCLLWLFDELPTDRLPAQLAHYAQLCLSVEPTLSPGLEVLWRAG